MRATSYDEVISGVLLEPERRFGQAVSMARDGLAELTDDGYVSGAIIYGSAVSRGPDGTQDFDPLSDLDILAITPDENVYRAERRLRSLSMAVRRETAVMPELGWMTESDARHGRHNILPTTLAWLGHQAVGHPEMTIGVAPTSMITPNGEDALGVVSTWFRVSRNNVMKAGTTADSQVAQGLSLPHIAARKSIDVLRFHDEAGKLAIPPPQSLCYSRREIGAMVGFVYGRDRVLYETFQELALIKQAFLGLIHTAATERFIGRRGYEATLHDMANDVVPKASDLLLRMHDQFDSAAERISGDRPVGSPAHRLMPEPSDDAYATSHGQPTHETGVYHYGLQSVCNY